MKYVLLFGSSADDARADMPEERYNAIQHRDHGVVGQARRSRHHRRRRAPAGRGHRHHDPRRQRHPVGDRRPVHRGQGRDLAAIGVVEVADLDAALALARTWPALQIPGDSVEVRPVFAM